MTPEGREKELTALAMCLAEKQLRDGTASSQTVNFFLKRGSPEYEIELDMKRRELELITAKTEAIRAETDKSELFALAIEAMRDYGGGGFHD
jgi:hypothetical protein